MRIGKAVLLASVFVFAQVPPAVQATSTDAARNTLQVRSSDGRALADQPLQFGRPFRAAEIARCPQLLVDGRPVASQADVKTRHPDGSVRFAVVSTILPSIPARRAIELAFADGPCPSAGALDAAAMLGDDFDFDAVVELNGGAGGSASARELLSRGKYTSWTAGPIVTTAIVADHTGKSADLGTDEHRSVRPSFEVQFWPALKATRTRVIVEIADTEKLQNQRYDVTIALGERAPEKVYERADVEHVYMSRWTRTFWRGAQPADIDIDYNVAYMASTHAIPNYDASIRLSPASRASMVKEWTTARTDLYAGGLWTRAMQTTGGRPDIGPYPKWMVAWLYDGSAELRDVALGQADLAAAWPVHLREGLAGKFVDRARTEDALGKPVSAYARPTLAMLDLGYNYTKTPDRVKRVGAHDRKGWSPDNAHQPQPFFLPYLLTGEHFYLEQLKFWAGFSLLDNSWGLQGLFCYSKGADATHLGIGGQLRGIAWGMRMVAEAAWAVPEHDAAFRRYLHDALEDTIVRFEGTRGVVRGDNTKRSDWKWANTAGDCSKGRLRNANPLHYWTEGNDGYGKGPSVARRDAIWMHAFLMYSLNRATELGFSAGALKTWFAPFFVQQVLAPGSNPYHLGDYTLPFVDAQTGALYRDWSEVDAEYEDYAGAAKWSPPARPNSNSTNSLDQGFASVALTALASTWGTSGSDAAWNRFAARHYAAWGWEQDPKWAILPRGVDARVAAARIVPVASGIVQVAAQASDGDASPASRSAKPPRGELPPSQPVVITPGLPGWAAGLPLYRWHEIPGTRLSATKAWTDYRGSLGVMGKKGILAYSGGALKTQGSELFIAGGGHADYAGNEVFSIVLGAEKPQWERRNDPSEAPPLADRGPAHYADGRPASRHTYWTLQFIDQRNVLGFFGAPSVWSKVANSASTVDAFSPETNDYLPAGTLPEQKGISSYAAGVAKDAAGNVYVHSPKGNLYRWNQASNTWTELGNRGSFGYETPYAIDTKRNRMFRTANKNVSAGVFDLARDAAASRIALRGPAAEAASGRGQLVYDAAADVFWFWKRGDSSLYRIDAETFETTVQDVGGTVPVNNVAGGGLHYTYGRFSYVPEMKGLVFMRDADTNVFFIRTAR